MSCSRRALGKNRRASKYCQKLASQANPIRSLQLCIVENIILSSIVILFAMADSQKRRQVRKYGVVLRRYYWDECAGWHLSTRRSKQPFRDPGTSGEDTCSQT
jgi:hypothetical protein